MEKDNEFMWRQFCRLGEMIGDGLHYEEPWISRDYKRLQKILLPETDIEKEYRLKIRKIKNEKLDKQILERLKADRCDCGGELVQTRSGSRTVVCIKCGKRYRYGVTKPAKDLDNSK
jgi:hypothetical protein